MKFLLLFYLACIFPAILFSQEMQKVTVFDKKVELVVPTLFVEMSKDDIQKRFSRGTPPDVVYSEKKGSPSISITLKNNRISQETIAEYVDLIEKSITTPLPQAKTIEKGKKVINERNVGYIIIITPSTNGEIYNYFFFTDLDKKLLVCNFSCMNTSLDKWEKTVNVIVASLKIN